MTLDGVPSKVFADFLLQHTIEGFFADPIYGGNKDMVGWRMLGFPGPYGGLLRIDRSIRDKGESRTGQHWTHLASSRECEA